MVFLNISAQDKPTGKSNQDQKSDEAASAEAKATTERELANTVNAPGHMLGLVPADGWQDDVRFAKFYLSSDYSLIFQVVAIQWDPQQHENVYLCRYADEDVEHLTAKQIDGLPRRSGYSSGDDDLQGAGELRGSTTPVGPATASPTGQPANECKVS